MEGKDCTKIYTRISQCLFRIFDVVNLPGFNDAAYNWETFESNTFFSLFTADSLETKYGFDLRLTCQKPLTKKELFCLL